MSQGINYLHSHSGLERELKLPKHIVLVDAQYANLFVSEPTTPFTFNGVKYLKINILSFVHKSGIFKNLTS